MAGVRIEEDDVFTARRTAEVGRINKVFNGEEVQSLGKVPSDVIARIKNQDLLGWREGQDAGEEVGEFGGCCAA
jgi:hypothetical protein